MDISVPLWVVSLATRFLQREHCAAMEKFPGRVQVREGSVIRYAALAAWQSMPMWGCEVEVDAVGVGDGEVELSVLVHARRRSAIARMVECRRACDEWSSYWS